MGITERKEMEKAELRKKISEAAAEIIRSEGIGKLSIRKIGVKIDYSPSIIYHYFKNKEDIINLIIEDGYGKILKMLKEALPKKESPKLSLVSMFREYIELVLEMPDYYQEVLFRGDGIGSPRMRVLERGVAKRNQTFGYLVSIIDQGVESGEFDVSSSEMTAQVIWCGTFGLLSRLIIEKELEKQQVEALINKHLELMIKSISKEEKEHGKRD